MTNQALARRLFDAFSVGDLDTVRSLCTEDCQAQRNFGDSMDLEAVLAGTKAILSLVSEFRYENIICTATETGFVEEHVVCARLPDGENIRIAACVIAELNDGKIARMREILDGAEAAPLMAALS